MTEEIWITLADDVVEWVDAISDRHTKARFVQGARQSNGEPQGDPNLETWLKQGRNGHRAEAAAHIFFGRKVPWSILSERWGLPDFSDFIEIKSRPRTHYGLKIKPKNNPQYAYLLVCGALHPRHRIVGWIWGHEARADTRWMTFGASGNPCWVVEETDPIIKSPHLLRDLALRKVR